MEAKEKQAFLELIDPGDFYWDDKVHPTRMTFLCPCGCGAYLGVIVEGPQAWAWDRNQESPTITPSIRHVGGCNWHGYLTKGQFHAV